MSRPTRTLASALAVTVTLVVGGAGGASAVAPATPAANEPTTTQSPPTTVPPTTTVPPPPTAPAPPPTAPAPAPTSAPAQTKLIPLPAPADTRIIGDSGPAATPPAARAADGPPAAPRLTDGQVDDVLRTLEKSGASSTSSLLEALRPLQNFGLTPQEAMAIGMGQFPVQGPADWTDDFGDYRAGPPVHSHKGDDLFAAFDTPVRAPVDGVVRYGADELGGNAAYVTAADGTYYYMAHLSGYAADLTSGAAVTQGRVVGFVGDSGDAKGGAPHLHFEIHPGGGAAVNPKPIVDGWVAAALARVPALIASFQPAAGPDAAVSGDDVGIPQVLVATGLTRRFSAARAAPLRDRPPEAFNRAVLAPLTPPALAPLLAESDRRAAGD